MADNNNKRRNYLQESVMAAADAVIEQQIGDLVTRATREICKYVNITAGDVVIAEPDNTIRGIIVGMILEYQEGRDNA